MLQQLVQVLVGLSRSVPPATVYYLAKAEAVAGYGTGSLLLEDTGR
jgi:hypothetical protein